MNFERECCFPAVVLYQHDMTVFESIDGLVVCRKTDLNAGQRGRFARSTIIDSNEAAWFMDGAEQIASVGPFGGYNIFLNRTIRIRPKIMSGPERADLDLVKVNVIERLKRLHGLTLVLSIGCTTIETKVAQELIRIVHNSTSCGKVILALLQAEFPERERWERLRTTTKIST